MEFITDLWLPILLSAVAVFFGSFLAWAVLPIHQDDYQKLPNEDAVCDMIRGSSIPTGSYAFPHHKGFKGCKDPEYTKRWMEGPTGTLNIWPKPNMGKNMALSFLVYLIISVFIAYIARHTLMNGTDFMRVFRIAGAAGVLGYSFAFLPSAIWFNHPRRATIANIVEGVVYGLITGIIFAALWPDAAIRLPG
jgi:hypothetical protein